MIEDLRLDLSKEDPSDFHKEMLSTALSFIKMSRMKMSERYTDWDKQDEVFRGIRYADAADVKAALKDEPVKMVVPNTFAQVMTFSSFLFLLFKQNRTFYELLPTGDEDYGTKQQDCETILENNLRYNMFDTLLYQHLLDTGRFGLGIFDNCWTRDVRHAYVTGEPTVVNYNGVQTEVRPGSEWKDIVKYEGNLVRAVSPYRWFPDTRFPLVDFQKGEFCGCEEEYTMTQLRKLEEAGEVTGVDYIQPLARNFDSLRGGITRASLDLNPDKPSEWLFGVGKSEGVVIVTKLQARIVPSKFKYGPNQKKLGPEEFPVLYHLWYANDNRVIRCEPAYWWHDDFGWTLSQFTPDMHRTINLGLADLIYRLQDVITWHINSRITDVRRNMRGRYIVDPGGIETTSLDGDGDIYLRSGVSKSGVDRWMKQLDARDVTAGHLSDADVLNKIMQMVTGVNDNIMGQYNQGRRSAQEARTVLSGAAGRMKMHGFLIWESSLGPLGKQMLSNLRQSLSKDVFNRMIGGLPEEQDARYKTFKGTPEEVIGGNDFMVFDSTLQSEKGFMAQSLQDLLAAILQADPTAAGRMAGQLDPMKVVDEIQYLRGAGNAKRFRYTPEEQAQIRQEQQQRLSAELESKKSKANISLSGKLTPEQEAAAANQAGLGNTPTPDHRNPNVPVVRNNGAGT